MVLRVLPRWHRAEREEELLAVLVADSDDLTREYGWPPAREVGGILALAVRTRLTHPGAPARTVAWRRVLAWTGVLALPANAVLAVAVALGLAVAAARGGVVDTALAGLGAAGGTQGWRELTRLLLPLAGAAGWALVLAGRHRDASVLVLLSLVPAVVAPDPVAMLTWASPLVLLPGAPALVRHRRWLVAPLAGLVVLVRARTTDPALALALALLAVLEVRAALVLTDFGSAVPLVLCLVTAVLVGILGWSRLPRSSGAAPT